MYATESIPTPRVQIDLDQLKHLDGVTPGDPSDVGLLLGEDWVYASTIGNSCWYVR